MEENNKENTNEGDNSSDKSTNVSFSAQEGTATTSNSIPMQNEGGGCPTCGKAKDMGGGAKQPNFVYALGTLRVQFPNVTIEKEYRQVVTEESTARLTDPEVVYTTLKNNRYLAREVCWVFSVEGLDIYLVLPRDPVDLDQLVEAIRRVDGERVDTDVVIGTRGTVAPIELCGLELPIVVFDKIYSFQKKELIKEIPKPEKAEERAFRVSADDLFDRIQQLADNVGETDEHRAVNYLAVRYPQIYVHTHEMFNQDYSLESIETRPSRLSKPRKLVDVIFSYQNRKAPGGLGVIDRYYCRIDVTGEYPFLQNPLTRFFDRD